MDNQYDCEVIMMVFDLDVMYYIGMELLFVVCFGGCYSDFCVDNVDMGYNWSVLVVSWL